MDLRVFGKKLAEERVRLGLKVAELAAACHIQPATQYLYEKGDRTPSAVYLNSLFALGARPEFLFPGLEKKSFSPTSESLLRAYIEVDNMSRDGYGRLLDLEERAKCFMQLIEGTYVQRTSAGRPRRSK